MKNYLQQFIGLKKIISILLGLFAVVHAEGVPYGPESLAGTFPFGVEVRVVCSKEVEQHHKIFQERIQSKLERRGITVVPEGSVVLRLTASAITSDDGFYVVHFLLECLQAATLAKDNTLTEAPVWDSYRMGEYREQDLLSAIDDMLRSFLNDYISVN